eukprot:749365-Hanusia_phi.AAC.1
MTINKSRGQTAIQGRRLQQNVPCSRAGDPGISTARTEPQPDRDLGACVISKPLLRKPTALK